MTDPFDLQHFLDAQPPVYPRVLAELRRGPRRPSRVAPPAPFCRSERAFTCRSGSAVAKMVNSRLQAVGRDVERRNRDRQLKAPPAGASRI